MTSDDNNKKKDDDASSSLSVVATGFTASTSSNATMTAVDDANITQRSSDATAKNNSSPGISLDFIGASNAMKKLFSISLDSISSPPPSIPSSSSKINIDSKPILLAVHNFDGTLIIDDAEDESNYDYYCQFNRSNDHDTSTVANASVPTSSMTLLPPSSQSLAMALSQTTTADDMIGRQQKSMLSSIVALQSTTKAEVANDTSTTKNLGSNNHIQLSSVDNKSHSKEQPTSSTLLAPPTAPREYIKWKFDDFNLLVGHEALIVRPPTTATTETASNGSLPQQQQQQQQQQNKESNLDAGISVRVEDLQFLQNAWKVFQQQQSLLNSSAYHENSRGNGSGSGSNTGEPSSKQKSYAQALLQQRKEASSTSILSSFSENDQKNLCEERELDDVNHNSHIDIDDNDNGEDDNDVSSGGGNEIETRKNNGNVPGLPLHSCIVPFTGSLGGRLLPLESSSSSPSSDPTTTTSSTGINSYSSPALSVVLDAYLDNLMANVPQLALCLKEKGLIQSVKLLPTEAIPSMMLHPSTLDTTLPVDIIHTHSTSGTSKRQQRTPGNVHNHVRSSSGIKAEDMFSPQIMEMNASALMRFLKTNCTRNHATYLLRHESLSEVKNTNQSGGDNRSRNQQQQHNIHLYDISSISTQGQKKWIWWLVTMSFRFAVRLRHLESSTSSLLESHKRAIRDRQRSLYQQTLDLLQDLMDIDGNMHESMVASVREHLADTYLSSAIGSKDMSTESAETTPCTRNVSSSEAPSSPSLPVINMAASTTMTVTDTDSSSKCTSPAKLPLPKYSQTMPFDLTSMHHQERQPYATVTIDALNKAEDHLVCGIKTLSSLFERDLQQRKLHQELKNLEKKAVLKRSRRRQRSRVEHEVNSVNNKREGNDDQIPRFSSAMVMQLFGMNYKLVNISLRLAEHHMGNYYSSSTMQALRSAARCLVDAADLLDYYEMEMIREEEFSKVSQNMDKQEDEKQELLQLQYIWLLEQCGHFARLFASDELWRSRGHTSGEDVLQILRDVENTFVGNSKYNYVDVLVEKTKGNVSLQSLSAVVVTFNMSTKQSDKAIEAAHNFLAKEHVLQRERRKVLVASCVSYSRAITAFQYIAMSSDESDQAYDKLVLLNLLRQRLGDACNETGKVLLAALRTLLTINQGGKKDDCSQLAAEVLLDSAEFWFVEGLESFKACQDTRNLALIRCNICQSYKLRANSGFAKQDASSSSKHAEDCLQQAANQLQTAHEDLKQRDTDPRTWDMVSEELAATFLVLGVRRRQSLLGGGNRPIIFQVMRLSPGEERSIISPMTRALEIYQQSNNAHQAAATHYQLALTFSKLWTCQLNETNTRKKLSKAFEHYSSAFDYFSDHFRGNEPTFCLLCLDLASLYAAIPGEEGLIKALGCCLDSCGAFSVESIEASSEITSTTDKAITDWYNKMEIIAKSVDDRVFKLLRSLVKIDPGRYKDLYREGLTAKMVRNVPDNEEMDVNPKAALLALCEVLGAIKKKYGIIVSK